MPTNPTDFRQFNNKTRLIDNFYAAFLKLPENTSNILGGNLKRMTRPTITFAEIETKYRGNTFVDKGDVRIGEVTFVFSDDEESLVSTLLNIQVLRQLNKHTDVFNQYGNYEEREYKFDVKCEILNSRESITESYVLRGCYISNVEYTEGNYTDDTKSEITVSIRCDNLDFIFKEEYIPLLHLR